MKYYIAIDAGGTKTDSVLFDQEGHVLARDLSAARTPLTWGRWKRPRASAGLSRCCRSGCPRMLKSAGYTARYPPRTTIPRLPARYRAQRRRPLPV